MITIPYFTMLVLLTTVFTTVTAPMISVFYDPSRPYMVNRRRNIQHHLSNTELRVVACITSEQSVAGIINLLEASNPTMSNPISVFALNLIELIARATAVFIDHETEGQESEQTSQSLTHKALKHFQKARGECINLQLYTSITTKRSMYQDICKLALLKKVSLIILPFDKGQEVNIIGAEDMPRKNVKSINMDVLAHAPCSVAVFVEKRPSQNLVNVSMRRSVQYFAVLFLGGADAREALAYADRMAVNPNVSLTVIRFLSHCDDGENKVEKKLDDGLVTWFWVKNEGNNQVVYREVVVENGNETVGAIQSMCNDQYDLLIVGRKHGTNPVVLQGLSNWSENHQLGVVGDYVASPDFGSRASILVVQQQVLRG